MAEQYIRQHDTISGKEGEVWFQINGKIRLGIEVKEISFNLTQLKKEITAVGHRFHGNKVYGVKGSGTMTCHYVTSDFRQSVFDYINTGKPPIMSITTVNEDPASATGSQRVMISGVILDSVDLAKLNSNDVLEESIPFTFDEINFITPFNELTN